MTITRQHEIHDRYRPNGTPRIAFTNVVGHYPHIQKIYILYTTTNRYFIHHTYQHACVSLPCILQSLCSCCNQQSRCQCSCSGSGWRLCQCHRQALAPVRRSESAGPAQLAPPAGQRTSGDCMGYRTQQDHTHTPR